MLFVPLTFYRDQNKVSDPSCVRLLSSVAEEVTSVVSAFARARVLTSVQIDTYTCVVVRTDIDTVKLAFACVRWHTCISMCMFPQ